MARALTFIFEIATVIGALIGGCLLLSSIGPGNSAIQTAATAAVGIGFVTIPYCLAAMFHRAAVRGTLLGKADLGLRQPSNDPEAGAVMEYLKHKLGRAD